MGAAILAFLAKEGVGLLLGALAKMLLDGWNSHQANQAQRQAGAAEAAAKTNAETVEIQDAVESVPRPDDGAVADSLRSGKF